MNEQRLASWENSIIGGSLLAGMVALLLAFGAAIIAAGGEVIRSPLFWGLVTLFGGYVMSMAALRSLAGKGLRRRIASWAFVAAFSGAVLGYVLVSFSASTAVLIVLAPEVLVLVLAVLGLTLAIHSGIRHAN